MRHVIVFLLTNFLAMQICHAATPVTWENLKDPKAAEFIDPFAALGIQDLRSLGTVLRLRQRLEDASLADEARRRIEGRLRSEEAGLAAAGVRTDWLLSQRVEIGRKRAAAALAGNPALAGKEIAITGYVIPVQDPDGGGVASGYLVPEQGMCSHMPAPDPNQMIRYRLSSGWEAQYIYEPVLLTGRLSIETVRQQITLLDGQVDMIAAFHMDVTEVRSLDEKTRPNPENRLWKNFLNFGKPAAESGQ